jgi:purine-binding chemotaxis protein CheW
MTPERTTENAEPSKNGRLLQLIGFTIGNNVFGVDIELAHEIIRSAPITAVPNAPDFVEGVMNLRGNIFPVIDLRKRLNLYSEEFSREETWTIILEIQGMMTGFIVDTVTRILKVYSGSIEEEPDKDKIPVKLDRNYISGVCNIGGALLVLLDFNEILLGDEVRELQSMGEGS